MTTLTTTITSAKSSDLVFITKDNQLVTDSIKVAEYFGKQHKDVLRKLESLDCSNEFASAHFYAHVQKINIGNNASRESKIYQMTKDGFLFLVMGFTGKRAAEIKEAYINAFNEMQAKLSHTPAPLERQRMMLTWENGRVIAAKTIDENHFISTREELPFVIKDPGFLSLDQLMTLNEAVNQRIACFVRVALGK